MSLELRFKGWFQCRLASDPDPTDEPRGISGCAFALVTEPDFDRVINFQPPSNTGVIRSPGPPIGVKVTDVLVNGARAERSELHGLPVRLLDGAKFEEQNAAVVPRNNAFIDPFHLEIGNEDLGLRRRALWDPDNPHLSFYEVQPDRLAARQPTLDLKSQPEVFRDSGIEDHVRKIANRPTERISPDQIPSLFWKDRLDELRRVRQSEKNLDALAAIEQRIDALQLNDWRAKRLSLLLGARIHYKFELNSGDPVVQLTPDRPIETSKPWQLKMWMGAWDNDALCGFAMGQVRIPHK